MEFKTLKLVWQQVFHDGGGSGDGNAAIGDRQVI
jgi:hypothetical protein